MGQEGEIIEGIKCVITFPVEVIQMKMALKSVS